VEIGKLIVMKNFVFIWPIVLVVNIFINSLIVYIALEIVVFAILQIEIDISFLEAMAIATVLLTIRGSFIIRIAGE